ncbi:hypothetical protein [Nostoc sp.]
MSVKGSLTTSGQRLNTRGLEAFGTEERKCDRVLIRKRERTYHGYT